MEESTGLISVSSLFLYVSYLFSSRSFFLLSKFALARGLSDWISFNVKSRCPVKSSKSRLYFSMSGVNNFSFGTGFANVDGLMEPTMPPTPLLVSSFDNSEIHEPTFPPIGETLDEVWTFFLSEPGLPLNPVVSTTSAY